MALDLGTLRAKIEITTDNAIASINNFQNNYNNALQNIQNSSPNLTKLAETFKNVGSSLTNNITKPLINLAKECVSLASDMEETQTKSDQIFGNMADTVNNWAANSINSMGMAKQTALDMAASFGDMSVSMGLSTEASADMSMNLVQLAADLSSFKNISVERAQTALTGVYTGEGEALKSLGIVMNEATLSQFAMASGCSKTYSEMTQAEKVQLRYNYVMNQTTNAQGDFAKTGDGVANSTRKLKEQLKQLGTQFGSVLYPVVQKVLTILNNFMNVLTNMDSGVLTTITIIATVVAAVGPLLTAISSTITAINTIKAALMALQLSAGGIIGIISAIVGVVGLAAGAFISASNNADEAASNMDGLAASADTASGAVDGTTDSLNNLTSADTEVEITANAEQGITVLNGFLEDITSATSEIYGIKISIDDDAVEIVSNFSGVLSQLANNGKVSSSTLKELQNSIKDTGQALKDSAADVVASQTLYVASLVASGQITYEEGVQRIDALNGCYSAYCDEVDTATNETLKVANGFKNGADATEILDAGLALVNNDMYGISVTAETTADKLQNLKDIITQFGTDNDTAKTAAQDLQNAIGGDYQSDIQNVTDAGNAYNSTVTSINESEAAQVTAVQSSVQAIQDKNAAFTAYCDLREQGLSDEEAWATVEQQYSAETVQALKADLDTMGSNYENSWLDRQMAQATFQQREKSTTIQAAKEIEAIHASADVNRTNAYTKYCDDITSLQLDYNEEAYTQLIDYYTQTGNYEAAKQLEQQQQMHSHLNQLGTMSQEDMETAAKNGCDGYVLGWVNGEARILSAVKSTANKIKHMMNQQFEIHSPSKWFKNMIGKNIMKGWEEGLLGEEPNLLKTIKKIGSNFKVGSAAALTAATTATYNSRERVALGATTANTITQNNTFMSKELTPYEQRMELRKLDKDLTGVFA